MFSKPSANSSDSSSLHFKSSSSEKVRSVYQSGVTEERMWNADHGATYLHSEGEAYAGFAGVTSDWRAPRHQRNTAIAEAVSASRLELHREVEERRDWLAVVGEASLKGSGADDSWQDRGTLRDRESLWPGGELRERLLYASTLARLAMRARSAARWSRSSFPYTAQMDARSCCVVASARKRRMP